MGSYSSKIEGASNTERLKPANESKSSRFKLSLLSTTSKPHPNKTPCVRDATRNIWQIDYKSMSNAPRAPIGIGYRYSPPEALMPPPQPPSSELDYSKTKTSFEIYERSYLQTRVNQDQLNSFRARITNHSDTERLLRVHERAANEARLKRIEEETKLLLRQHDTQVPKLSSIYGCIPIADRLASKRLNDHKIFPPPSKYPELTDEIIQEVTRALKAYPPDEVLVELDGVQILRKDIQTLSGLNWLNDEIINAYMTLIVQRSQQFGFKKVYSFNTFFYPKLRDSGYSSVKRWTRRVDIFSYSYIIIPVHLGNHWCLAFIDFTRRTIAYYDSMGGSPNRCCDIVLNYLREESNDKKKQNFDDENWKLVNSYLEGIPQQFNCSDCGVFACTYAEHLTRQAKLDFTQKDMPYFRKKMIYEIIKKRILE